jgi:hypothetical protein
MSPSPVTTLPTGRARERRHQRRLDRAISARRQLEPRAAGRAWVNGREVDGTDRRFAHLGRSYD